MSETVSEPEKNVAAIGPSPSITRRMFIAAVALGLALLVSFLFHALLCLPDGSGEFLRTGHGAGQTGF